MVIVLLTVAGRVAHMAVAGRVAHRAVVGKVAHIAAAGMVARMVAGEAELSMQMERDMVLDKLGVGVLQDILLVLGKLKRQRMPTVLALREHTGHQFYPPSCSSGRHKTINEGKTHQQKQGNKDK
jgi:hypothetical protein